MAVVLVVKCGLVVWKGNILGIKRKIDCLEREEEKDNLKSVCFK